MFTRQLERAGAITLAIGTIGFVVIFFYLNAAFLYPDVLDHGASDVLPRLEYGGRTLQIAWAIYAALPLTLVVAGIASMSLLEDGGGRGLARLGGAAAVIAGLAMFAGLVRWSTIHVVLADMWSTAGSDERSMLYALFHSVNRFLGSAIGELLGELSLAAWFATIGIALRRSESPRMGMLSLGAAAIVAVGALRQLTSIVDPVAAVANIVLPLWLFVIALVLWQHAGSLPGRSQPDTLG